MKLILTTLWILLCGAIAAGVYWGFLIAPVSTGLALGATAMLALIVLAIIGLTVNGALEILTNGVSIGGLRKAARLVPAVVPAALIVLIAWWMTSRLELWVSENSGPINAWFIARFGWDDVSWLFTAVRYAANWFRWVVGVMLALSLMAAILAAGWPAMARASWLRRGLRPRGLLIATLAFVALIALPWTYLVPWRPESLPPTSVETMFIATKLGLVAVLAALAFALMTSAAAPTAPGTPAPGTQAPGTPAPDTQAPGTLAPTT